MQSMKVFGLAAVGAMFVLAAPVERAQAVSLINPGAAQSVQDVAKPTTEVHWHHGHGWHPRHHWRHRWHRHHHHHRHWR